MDEEPLTQGRKLYDLVPRNNVTLEGLIGSVPKLARFVEENEIDGEAIEEAEIEIKVQRLHRTRKNSSPRNFTDWKTLRFLRISISTSCNRSPSKPGRNSPASVPPR